MSERTDFIVIGAGIVGLATAFKLVGDGRGARVVVLEKEASVGFHQSGRNSGVLHTGMYYKPGSLKALNCRAGKAEMERFCEEQGIRYEICGKVIVAVDESELPALDGIFERGTANGVQCRKIGREELAEIEPHAAGVAAIHVPEAGIADYPAVCRRLAELVEQAGGSVRLGVRVQRVEREGSGVVVETDAGAFEADAVVNCAGLYSDRVLSASGGRPEAKIVPFRGEYYELKPAVRGLCRNLIYPVPDPSFPFLGVHLTRMIDGSVECGPNAVLAFAREGYRMTTLHPGELFESLTYPGFVHMAAKHWRAGAGEMWRSFSKRAFVKALRRLVPDLAADDLEPAPAGVRAQAIKRDGSMVDDFLIERDGAVIHVLNAPSPAATSSLAIGATVAERARAVRG